MGKRKIVLLIHHPADGPPSPREKALDEVCFYPLEHARDLLFHIITRKSGKSGKPIGMEGTLWGEPPLTDNGPSRFFGARPRARDRRTKKSDKGFLGEEPFKTPETHSNLRRSRHGSRAAKRGIFKGRWQEACQKTGLLRGGLGIWISSEGRQPARRKRPERKEP